MAGRDDQAAGLFRVALTISVLVPLLVILFSQGQEKKRTSGREVAVVAAFVVRRLRLAGAVELPRQRRNPARVVGGEEEEEALRHVLLVLCRRFKISNRMDLLLLRAST